MYRRTPLATLVIGIVLAFCAGPVPAMEVDVGGGFGVIAALREVYVGDLSPDNDVNGTLGAWINGGAFWRLGKKFNIGADLRFSTGELTLFRDDVQVGGTIGPASRVGLGPQRQVASGSAREHHLQRLGRPHPPAPPAGAVDRLS